LRGAAARGGLTTAVAALAVAAFVAGCEPPLRTETGLVLRVDSPSLGRVDGFSLRTDDGRVVEFDTRSLRFDQGGFPAAHLSEHQASAERVRVTYRVSDGRNVVVRLADAAESTQAGG
jgi:hypothetical protein